MVLRREGFDVATFARAEAALGVLADGAHGAGALLTDLRMPDMDGLELLSRARELDPTLPVVLMTAHATVANAVAALREGAFDYLQKPFENAELVARVRRAVEMRSLRAENAHLRRTLAREQGVDGIVAESEGMRAVLSMVSRVGAVGVECLDHRRERRGQRGRRARPPRDERTRPRSFRRAQLRGAGGGAPRERALRA